jgi:hypothetical protein
MDNDDLRDHEEETYLARLCPACDNSPCIGGAGRGSCEPADASSDYGTPDAFQPYTWFVVVNHDNPGRPMLVSLDAMGPFLVGYTGTSPQTITVRLATDVEIVTTPNDQRCP